MCAVHVRLEDAQGDGEALQRGPRAQRPRVSAVCQSLINNHDNVPEKRSVYGIMVQICTIQLSLSDLNQNTQNESFNY